MRLPVDAVAARQLASIDRAFLGPGRGLESLGCRRLSHGEGEHEGFFLCGRDAQARAGGQQDMGERL